MIITRASYSAVELKTPRASKNESKLSPMLFFRKASHGPGWGYVGIGVGVGVRVRVGARVRVSVSVRIRALGLGLKY